jgi:hypothetical protein
VLKEDIKMEYIDIKTQYFNFSRLNKVTEEIIKRMYKSFHYFEYKGKNISTDRIKSREKLDRILNS